MRFRALFVVSLLVVVAVSIPGIAHAAIPFFGPIIPRDESTVGGTCPGNWALLITVINNIISLLISLAIVFVAPLMVAYSGFLFVINPLDPSGIAKAKGVLTNTVVGIVIALASWMIVDAVMAVLYDSESAGATWTSLITSNGIEGRCINLAGSLNNAGYSPGSGQGADLGVSNSLGAPPSGRAGTSCDPAVVQQAAAAGGFTITNAQANVFACIAAPESSCASSGDPKLNYAWGRPGPTGEPSTAAGAFQVTLKGNSIYYENPACYAAVGLPTNGSTRLNCRAGFTSAGYPNYSSPNLDACIRAASDLNCSASAAANLMLSRGGSFSPWQADVNSARQTGCISSTSLL